MTISMGPQHPSTHGVLRLELVLDGEMVVKATPDIGYLHTGMEKLFEYKKYQQGIVITDRMDYLNPLGNNLAYVMAGEKLLGLEIPERAQTIRVLMCELQRIASHLVWLGTHALDIGAMTVFFYCFREREKILNLIEAASGGRLTPSYFRIGGLMMDLPAGFENRCKQFLDELSDSGRRVSHAAHRQQDLSETHAGHRTDLGGRCDRLGTFRSLSARQRRESRHPPRESVQRLRELRF